MDKLDIKGAVAFLNDARNLSEHGHSISTVIMHKYSIAIKELLEELHGMSIEGFREFMYRQLHEQKITFSCMEQVNIMLDKWKKEQPKADVKIDLKAVPSITEEIRQTIRNLPNFDRFGEQICEPKPKGQIKIQKTLSITFPAGECSDEIINREIVNWLINEGILSPEIKQTAEGVELVYSIADGGGQG